jgi:hypothetical protein
MKIFITSDTFIPNEALFPIKILLVKRSFINLNENFISQNTPTGERKHMHGCGLE